MTPAPLPTFTAIACFAIGCAGLMTTGCGDERTPETPSAVEGVGPASSVRPLWSLPDSKREMIWGLEHAGNLLGRYGFGPLRQALRDADADALRSLIGEEFRGTTLDAPTETTLDRGVVRAARLSGEERRRELTADGLVELLLDQRARFDTLERASLGVMRIGPADRSHEDGTWNVRARLDLVGRTAEGLVQVRMQVDLETVEPTEETLAAPGWLVGFHLRRLDWAESHDRLFEQVTEEIGIETESLHDNWTETATYNLTGGVYACDFDRNGCADLLVMDVNPGAGRLLSGGTDGTFTDVTDVIGLAGLRDVAPRNGHAAVADLDGDGWEDILLPSGELWRNVEGRRFERADAASNFRQVTGGDTEFQRTVETITVADYDCDGLVDLYVHRLRPNPTSWLEETSDSRIENQLLRNLGGWLFEDVTRLARATGDSYTSFNSVWFHANDDRWPDLYLPHEFGDGVLYVNVDGRRFEARDVDPRVRNFGTMGSAAGDLDGDGRTDLYLPEMYSKAGQRIMNNLPDDAYPPEIMTRFRSLVDGSELYLNAGDGTFTASGARSLVNDIGWAYGPALEDFDNDGLLDVYATCGYISRDRTKPDG